MSTGTLASPRRIAVSKTALTRDLARRSTIAAELLITAQLAVAGATSDLDDAGRCLAAGIGLAIAAAAIAVTWTVAGRARAAALLLLGCLGVVTGAGIGAVHLVIEGPSAGVLLGLLALVAGIGLLLGGAWVLIRSVRGWRRLWAIPVGFLLLQFVVLPLAGAVYGTHLPYVPVTAPTPDGAQLVAFDTADGVTLTAWYTPTHTGAAVVLLHGSGGNRADTVAHAAVLTGHGYGVLAVDARGGSASTAPGVPWGWHGNADIAAAVSFLASKPDVDPSRIGVVGLSMGGEQAIAAAAADRRIKAVVAEGASLHSYGDLAYLPTDLTGWIQRVETVVMFATADLMTSASVPESLADSATHLGATGVLLIAGMNVDEGAAAADLLRVAPSNVQVWRLPDTPHIGGLAWHPAEWAMNVLTFLDLRLARS